MAQHLTTIDYLLLPTYNVLLLNVLLTTYLRARSTECFDVSVLPDELGVAWLGVGVGVGVGLGLGLGIGFEIGLGLDELGATSIDQVQDVARLHDSDELGLRRDTHCTHLISIVGHSQVQDIIVQ